MPPNAAETPPLSARKSRFPHPLALLLGGVFVAAALTWTVPSGVFDRVADPATGRDVVVPGSFHRVEAEPVGPFEALVALTRGMVDAGDIVFLVFMVGGAFVVVDRTGALRAGLESLLRRLGRRELLLVPIACLLFGTGGVLYNMQEEIIPLIPVLLVVTRRLRLRPVTAVAMSAGSAVVGSAFSPINPFQVGIAQKIAQLPLLSGAGFRVLLLTAAMAVWTGWVMRRAVRERAEADRAELSDADGSGSEEEREPGDDRTRPVTAAHALILALVALTFTVYVWGVMDLEWGFHEMSALFFVMGAVAGLLGGLGVNGTARAYARGFSEMALAAMLIGVARAIFVVLDDGMVVDTVVYALSRPLEGLPATAAAAGMMGVHTVIHLPVPSMSGHAVLTMPIMTPLSDLLGISRQVAVLAYQYGAGLCDMMTPTNGALMAILAAAGVPYDRWFRFALPLWGTLFALGAMGVVLAMAVGLT